MASVPKDHWYFVVLCIVAPLLKVSVQQKGESITVSLEEGMILGCLCPWNGSISMVTWTKSPNRSAPIAVFHPHLGKTFSWRYRQRVEFLRAAPLDGSVALRNVTHQDLGVYHCTITTFPRGSWSREVTVEDRDEPPEEEEEEEEQQEEERAPAPGLAPEADVRLEARSGDDVSIPCFHDDGTTAILVERYVEDTGDPDDAWSRVAWLEAEDEEGTWVNCSPPGGGGAGGGGSGTCGLLLLNVTSEDAGLYRCRTATDARERTATVHLVVREPGEFRLSDYMVYIYIGSGATCFVFLLTVLLVLLIRCRKDNRRHEYTVKSQPPVPASSSTNMTS